MFVLPLNSLLGIAASLSASVRDRLLGADILAPRLRPPRYVSSREPLALYSWINVSLPAAIHGCVTGDMAQCVIRDHQPASLVKDNDVAIPF